MRLLDEIMDDIAANIGPIGCVALLVIYCAAVVIFFTVCNC